MNNGFNGLYESNSVCNPYESFNIMINVNNNKFTFYVNDNVITSYTDNSSPYISGSVGLRGYISTALYKVLNIQFIS